MAEIEFKIGDVVELKSGGPKMTITKNRWIRAKDDVPMYEVRWFKDDNQDQTANFPADALKRYEA